MAHIVSAEGVRPHPSLLTIIKNGKKPENFWFRIYYGLASFLVWVALRLGWTPNQLTVTGALLNLAGFVYFMAVAGSRRTIIVTYIIFNIAHVFDCADGQLAYVAKMRSQLGYWLDSSLDVLKSAYLSLLLIKMVYMYSGGSAARGWLPQIAVCAAVGNLVNYAVSMHALRYREITDAYAKNSLEAQTAGRGVKRYFAMAAISHIREYGNFLLVFVLFALDGEVALCCVIVLGLSHWIFALRRIIVISRRLGIADKNPPLSAT